MSKRIYLAGRITGLNYMSVKKSFAFAEQFLESIGFEVINPLRIVPMGTSWTESMRICLDHLTLCNYIALLPGWHNSVGAKMEYQVALKMEEEGRMLAIIHLVDCITNKTTANGITETKRT